MKLNEIKEILKSIDEAKLQEVEFEQEGIKIKVKRNQDQKVVQIHENISQPAPVNIPQATQAMPAAPAQVSPQSQTSPQPEAGGITIKSPMTGTFYAASSPENPPFATPGMEIKEGDTVCIIEAMKLFNEIEADVSGTVEKVLVKDGEPVELDQPLILLKP